MNVRISKGASFRIPFREDDLLFQGLRINLSLRFYAGR